jgi:MarR family transcriptional regulator, negative regulator of the multidrug operon emrRAB
VSHAHEVNAFGALALETARRVQAAGELAIPHGASAPAGLVALNGLANGESIDALRRLLGLTHSGAVRLVDRLSEAGLVERRVGVDGRSVSLRLTPEGRRSARRISARREAVIEQVFAALSASERTTLTRLHERMLGQLTESQADRRRVCRLCDVEACGPDCPARTEPEA